MGKTNSRLKHIPIWLLMAYLIITLVLYAFGPFAWENPKPGLFWLLQMAYLGALLLGWQIGIRRGNRVTRWQQLNLENKILRWIPVILVFSIIIEIVNLFRMFGFATIDFPALFRRVVWGIQNPGESYNLYQSLITEIDGSQVLGGRVMTIINYLWELIGFLSLLLSTYYFKKLSQLSKGLLVFLYFLVICEYMSIGTNIGVFRLVLAVLLFAILHIFNCFSTWGKNKRRRYFCIFMGATLIAVLVLIVLFDTIMKSRGGILIWDSPEYNVGGYGLNKNSFVFDVLPESLYPTVISASAYLTQGYQGMALALSVDWQPVFGLGHNMWLMKTLRGIGFDVMPRTYQVRIMEVADWDSEMRWHSMYTWWANDYSFLGVIIVMFAFGFIFAMAYKDCLETKNPFARIMVFFLTLMAFFIPCNNQLFQSSNVLLSFCATFVLWLMTRGTLPVFSSWVTKYYGRKG